MDRMNEKRVRFKDSEPEPDHPESFRFDVGSAPCQTTEDLPVSPATTNKPKTSEFAFFKRLKQDVSQNAGQNPLNREPVPVRNFRRSNSAKVSGNSKRNDGKSSQYIRKSTTNEIGSFLPRREAALGDSAMPSSEHDHGIFNCPSVIQTPISINLDSFHPTTANVSVSQASLQEDGDIFSSKRQKLLQLTAKTLFPEADEVPRKCNMIGLLLSRLLPENPQEHLLQTPLSRQPETELKCQLNYDSNIQLKETFETSRMLLKGNKDNLDNYVSSPQFHELWGNNDTSTATCSNRMLLTLEPENEQGRYFDDIASGSGWLNRSGDVNLLTWDNEDDYSAPGSTNHDIVRSEAYDISQSHKYRDQSCSYELLNRICDSSTAAKNNRILFKDEIHDVNDLDNLNSCYDSCSRVPFEGCGPSALHTPRNYSPDYLIDSEIQREPSPLLLGWKTNELDMHDTMHRSHMELELYCPPPTSTVDHQNSLELKLHSHSSTQNEDPWKRMQSSTLSLLSPYSYQEHDIQGYFLLEKNLVPRSASVPYMLSYGSEHLNPDESGLFKDRDRSLFLLPQKEYRSLENMLCERSCSSVEALLISQDFESDDNMKCKQLTGYLEDHSEMCADNVLDLFRQGNSSSQFFTANENDLAISPSAYQSLLSGDISVGKGDSFSLLLQTESWRDTEAQTYDEENGHWSNYL
ncbi:unnamed protein product [Amaranthus hypochondriacus]